MLLQLQPDTIMIIETASAEKYPENPQNNDRRKCFIIDSKYYSYTMLRKQDSEENESEQESVLVHGSIPGTDSIQKQITYAQYIDNTIENNCKKRFSHQAENYRFSPENIFNVFILPANNKEKELQYIANATSDWHDGSKNYHTVHAVTLDTKFLMQNGNRQLRELQEELAVLIEKMSS